VHQEVLTWSSLLQRLWKVAYQQWCPSFLVDCCVFLAALGKRTRKMVSVLGQFCVKIGEIQRTYIVFYTKISSLPLTLSDDHYLLADQFLQKATRDYSPHLALTSPSSLVDCCEI
jgi:hypothetical protein